MQTIFLDTQDKANPNNGLPVESGSALSRIISDLRTREPFFFQLEVAGGPTLLVGLGPKVGCAQHTDERGISMMAVAPGFKCGTGFVEFAIAGTPTPVPARYCMRPTLIEQIAAWFIQTGDRSPDFTWETV